ncbi:hypothetical protein RDI58_028152 [Solanum bulbocastanum]|uniref:Uncharacterized protein n=1 Tax=Solanum bulbocastanum TaxID=147425 RepID=A0AAN8XYN3_SOLBU
MVSSFGIQKFDKNC